jgi:hypothetical protein
MTELFPKDSSALKIRLQIFTQRVIANELLKLKGLAEKRLKEQGY